MVAPRQDTSVQDTLENLVQQFSDVYAFYRELIQNALDAGTNRVDVFLEFIPSKTDATGNQGVMIIHVDDYGEGMNREIIDNQLTRLFSSGKEKDLTKIGKFGIGFVSIFAIKPEAVIIDTSRDGEDWRIIFNEKKEFERFKRDFPVDGTKIQIIKSVNKGFYQEFVKRSKETVHFWCKHSEAEIYFMDELINEPFDVKAMIKVSEKTPHAEVAAGYVKNTDPPFGFYNQGLTLLEGKKNIYNLVTFKIKSPYLEHTLTRDNVREDENYFKAMAILERIVREKLPVKLFEEVEREVLKNTGETQQYRLLLSFVHPFVADVKALGKDCRGKAVALDVDGEPLSLPDLLGMAEKGVIYFDNGSNPVTRALKKQGSRVVKVEKNSTLFKLLQHIAGQENLGQTKLLHASSSYFIPLIIPKEKLSPIQKELIDTVNHINRRMSQKTSPIQFADFDYPGSCIEDQIFVMQINPGELTPSEELGKKENLYTSLLSVFSRTKALILNQKHPYIKKILELGEKDLEFSSYLLAKLLYMDDGLDTVTDAKLAGISLDRRQ